MPSDLLYEAGVLIVGHPGWRHLWGNFVEMQILRLYFLGPVPDNVIPDSFVRVQHSSPKNLFQSRCLLGLPC